MKLEELVELLLEGRLRLKVEWDKIPVTCPYCDWHGEADTPSEAKVMSKAHLRECPNEPLNGRFRAMLRENNSND